MKNMQLYSNKNMQQVCRYGLAAMVFFVGTASAFAQASAEAGSRRAAMPTEKYQMVEIKGTVVDAATGEPLAGAQIKSFNNDYYTAMAGEDGSFTIKVPTFVTSLITSLEGYGLIQTALGGRTDNVEIKLFTDKYSATYTTKNSASKYIETEDFDLAILDVMLPGVDGFALCSLIRESHTYPVIMLTAKTSYLDRISGLSLGADDYVTKPFSVPELMARVKTNLRRAPEVVVEKEIVFEDIRMDLVEKKVFRSNNYVHLGPTEFRLLKLLMQDPGKVFSREILLKTVWGDNIYVESRTVDVHIRRLRRALNEYGEDYIRTVRATGYSIDNSADSAQE